ncbi:MAG: tRNA-dihydrouridine synthase family protein [Candidatus Kaiserbacteria bacterium]|nr:tRNA-dihydrouridine synthase family protein [Candidatus Kaiserbacteria bacterium]
MTSFWNQLPKPFFAMAPMKDVTDVAFRTVVARRGKPDVFWTEFVSADGLSHAVPSLLRDLQFNKEEHPIVAQIFSSKPEMIAYATKLVAQLGFDGVDLNMGCPDRAIEKQGAGAALMKNPKLAVEIIRAAKEASDLPVSVKTRVGYSKESLDEWLPILLEAEPAAITIHLRTRKELSLVPADWELMKKAVAIRNRINPNVLLIGNGDVGSLEEGRRLAAETGCDGIMIGRAVFGNPWVFERISGLRKSSSEFGFTKSQHSEHGLDEKLEALLELAQEFEKITPPKNFSILKKHIKAFVTGFSGAAELRAKLMMANNATELKGLIEMEKGAHQ